jgi:PAS domain S-box-containing protein
LKPLPWTLLLVFMLLTIGISTSGYFFYKKQKKDSYREQTANLRAVADLKAAEISNWRQQMLNDGHLIFYNRIMVDQLLSFLRQPTATDKSRISKWLSIRRSYLRYLDIIVSDAAGNVQLSARGGESRIGNDELKLMDEARRKREVVLSDLYRSEYMPQIHLETVVPLVAGESGGPASIDGFLLMSTDPQIYLFPLIQSWPTPSPSAETVLVCREGDTVVFLNELRHRQNTALNLRLPLTSRELPAAMAILGKTGAFTGRDYRGVAVWSVVRPVPDSPWFIVAKVDREEIERPIRRSALAIFLIALSLILIATMLILFLWQRQNARFLLRQFEAESQKQALVQHFDYLTRYANDIILLADEEGNILDANERAMVTYGYGREALLGMNIRDLRVAEEKGKLAAQMVQAEEWQGLLFETAHQKKDGAAFPVEISARVIAVNNKKYFQSIVRDISERKRVEENLRISEERFHSTLDNMMEGCQIIGFDWRYLYVNNAVASHGHQAKDALLGRTMMEVYPGIENTEMFASLRRCREERQPHQMENEFTYPDGTKEWFELSIQPVPEGVFILSIDITERKQAEEALRQSEKRLRETQEMARLGHWYWNVKTGDVEWSEEVYRIFQLDPNSFTPKIDSILALSPWPEDHERDQELIRRAMETHEKGTYEQRFLRPDKSIGYYHSTFQGNYDDRGDLIAIIGTVLDITELKRAEMDLQILSSRNQAMLEAIPDIIMEVDTNKVYTWANKAGIEFFGTDVVGREAAFYFEGEQQTYEAIKPIFNGQEEVIYVQSWQRRHDGEKRLLAWWCRVLKDSNGNVSGALSSARDITEIKRAEEALGESERKFRETVINLDEGYYSVTLEGILLEHNQAFCRILGYDIAQDMRGVLLPDFWQNPDQRQEYLKAFAAIGSITNYQINAKTRTGEMITVLACAHLVKDENNRPQRIEGVFLDISKRIRAEAEIRRLNEELEQRVLQRTAQLEAANKELEAFSYSVSHDLRAPLRAIEGFARIVLDEYAPKLDDEGRRLLDVITGNTRKMGQLIDDLLAFSRLSRQQMAFGPVDMVALADDVFPELKSTEKGRRIEFKINALPAAHGDRSMLRHVLLNLLSNALKFTRPRAKARIEFGGQAAIGETIYYIKDNGVGFDMEYAHKLFGVFQRLHGSEEFEGTGVGLAIVQRIVLRHGGRVWAKSGKKGGATFYFSLPTEQGTGDKDKGIGLRV